MAEIGLFEAMKTQRAIRSFRPDPVPEKMIWSVIEAATKAPSGGNSQPWAFVVVDDPNTRDTIAGYARKSFEGLYQRALSRGKPGDPPPFPRLAPMVQRFEQIPVLIFVCLVHAEGGAHGDPPSSGQYGSIYPAIQNLLLAARGLGLGATLTSGLHSPFQAEIKALLGIPDNVELVAMIPLGFPDKERYGRTTRRPAGEVTHWNGWAEQRQPAQA